MSLKFDGPVLLAGAGKMGAAMLSGWLAQGLTNYQIGRQMFVSEGSVKQYLTHIGAKMGAKSRTQMLIKSIQLNIVDPRNLPALDHVAGDR